MKIAILTPNDTHLAETFIQNHIKYLKGDKIVIHGGKFPYLLEGKKLSFIKLQLFKLVQVIRKLLGLEVSTFREYQLTKILKKNHIDVVLAEFLITAAETQNVCKKLNIPMVSIALGFDISEFNILKTYRDRYKSLFQYASFIIVVSNHMKKILYSMECPEEKIIYSPASASKDFFDIEPIYANKQILAVGRFVEKKAPHITIKAFKRVLDKEPDAILTMAGDGVLLNDCQALVLELGIEASVAFVGKIDRSEHKKLLTNSLMFVQHSITANNGDMEGTPVAILEASAAGLPVVSTYHAGIPDVIIHEQTGLLCREHDVDTIAEHMLRILKDVRFARQLGDAGKAHIKAHFSMERHLEILQDVLEQSIKKK